MRTMYDAVTASRIPADAQMVAGYCDTIQIPQWTTADWARFPNAVKVRIAKKATTNDGHVLDVEIGDATPAQAPGWVRMRRSAGADPTVYCNASTWPAVRAAFAAAGVAEPHYWIAKYDGHATIPEGAIAKQYQNTAGWDLSVVADHWPGVDTAQPTPSTNHPGEDDDTMITAPAGSDEHIDVFVKGRTELYVGCSWQQHVDLTAILFFGKTGEVIDGAKDSFAGFEDTPARVLTIDDGRPGPLTIPADAVTATLRYSADHSFVVGVA